MAWLTFENSSCCSETCRPPKQRNMSLKTPSGRFLQRNRRFRNSLQNGIAIRQAFNDSGSMRFSAVAGQFVKVENDAEKKSSPPTSCADAPSESLASQRHSWLLSRLPCASTGLTSDRETGSWSTMAGRAVVCLHTHVYFHVTTNSQRYRRKK